MSTAMGFFLGTEERVRNSRGKWPISVRATEVLPYIENSGTRGKTEAAISFFVALNAKTEFSETILSSFLLHVK